MRKKRSSAQAQAENMPIISNEKLFDGLGVRRDLVKPATGATMIEKPPHIRKLATWRHALSPR